MEKDQSEQGATGEPVAPDDAVSEEDLRTQVVELGERAERLMGNWQRAQADLTNYRRQVEREREEVTALSNAALMADILPIMDDLERSVASVASQLRSYTWVEGIWLILKKLEVVLTAYGLKGIEAKGETLDPLIHQAVAEVDGEVGQVVDVVQRGFKLHERLLRPALVTVGRAQGDSDDSGTQPETPPAEPEPTQAESDPAA